MKAADGTMISPNAFMPAAERFSIANRIDRWIVSNTLRWMSELPDLELVENLSINLSGQSIGVKTVAEYVETTSALGLLRELGVDYAQGYLLHRPEPLDNMVLSSPFAALASA